MPYLVPRTYAILVINNPRKQQKHEDFSFTIYKHFLDTQNTLNECTTVSNHKAQMQLTSPNNTSLAVPTFIHTVPEEWRDTDLSDTCFNHNPPEPDMKVQKKVVKMWYQS